MPKFVISETIYSERVNTVRGGTLTNKYSNAENGKAMKLAGVENYVACASGDAIEAIQGSSRLESQGTVDGYAIIGVYSRGYKNATVEGAAMVPGDYVVSGTPNALGVPLAAFLKVLKPLDQAAARAAPFKARVVGLGPVGSGAVGTQVVIELL